MCSTASVGSGRRRQSPRFAARGSLSATAPRYERPAARSKLDPFKDEIRRLLRNDRLTAHKVGSRVAAGRIL
jgi:hypothetical protein